MKKILLISDVKGWGGWVRGQYLQRYLSDYDVSLTDGEGFKQMWLDKQLDFDLYYPLFHTMILWKSIKYLLDNNQKVITMVTGKKVIRASLKLAGRKALFMHEAKRLTAIGSNNFFGLEELRSLMGDKFKGETFYAPRGVDPEVFYPIGNDTRFTVAYVGKPVYQKGLEDFIRPACEIAGVELIANTRNYTEALPESDMNVFYNKAHAYVVASTIDGTPNPALEAASCGLPIISNVIGNMPDFIKEGLNGFIVERQVEAYAEKLKWMKNHINETKAMGRVARATILRDWTWEKVINSNERRLIDGILRTEQ